MAIKVEIVSRETIKPSKSCSSTFKLSLLDQLAPSFYVPIVLFYEAHDRETDVIDGGNVVEKLKSSLSETLAKFYPLAGRIYDDAYVEVRGDNGVLFVEARADVELSAILEKPDVNLVQNFLPIDSYKGNPYDDEGVPVLAVQSNVFQCGGVAVGICISHKIADGTALSAFLSAWAQASLTGDVESLSTPRLDAAEVFPPREIHVQSPRNLMKRGKIVTRRFVFDSQSLARLKAEAASGDVNSCTRVEAVTALISKTATDSTASKRTSMAISHVVNLRPRMDPPLPENTLGNIWRCAVAAIKVEDDDQEIGLSDVVGELRKEIRKVDRDYTAKLRTEEGFVQAFSELREVSQLVSQGAIPFYKFSSWIRFPIYDTDFGWGKPVWACVTTVPIEGAVILMSDRSGKGIEAWVNLEERHMACFEQNPDLLRFASRAPGSSL